MHSPYTSSLTSLPSSLPSLALPFLYLTTPDLPCHVQYPVYTFPEVSDTLQVPEQSNILDFEFDVIKNVFYML